MKTIQEKLCDRVYELLPEKKELEFGCEVKAQRWNKNQNLSWGKGAFIQKDMFSGNPYIMYSKNDLDFAYHKIEIIGQPLGIAELLLAIGKQDLHYVKMWVSDNIDTHNLILEIDNDIKSRVKYDLSQDNLLNQSNELCELCLGLLNK